MSNINTSVYTVVDIRRAFEGFEADFRMIAKRTNKMSTADVDNILYDIIKLAEAKHLFSVDVALIDASNPEIVVRATKFTVNENGKTMTAERAGGNDWVEVPNTELTVILTYNQGWKNFSAEEKTNFRKTNGFKTSWGASNIDNSFPHLQKSVGQLYASNGFEVQKNIFK